MAWLADWLALRLHTLILIGLSNVQTYFDNYLLAFSYLFRFIPVNNFPIFRRYF